MGERRALVSLAPVGPGGRAHVTAASAIATAVVDPTSQAATTFQAISAITQGPPQTCGRADRRQSRRLVAVAGGPRRSRLRAEAVTLAPRRASRRLNVLVARTPSSSRRR